MQNIVVGIQDTHTDNWASKSNIISCMFHRHHGMARPQVADRGTASDKERSCE